MDGLKIGQMIGAKIGRNPSPILDGISFNNPFRAQVWRRMGVKKQRRLVAQVDGHNGVTVVGKNYLLDVSFGSPTTTQITTWYIGLINNTPTPTLAEADTLASHAGWAEWTSYTGTRKAWTAAAAANKIKGTTTVSTFTMNAAGTLYGIMVASVTSGTVGTLWSTGAFNTTLAVVSTDDVKVTYGIRT